MKPFNTLAVAAVLLAAVGATTAQTQGSVAASSQPAAASASSGPMVDGEIRKIDKEAAKLTLRHGPLENLGMPSMTMVFRAADPKMLDGLKEGDKVKFTADRINGAFTVTALEVVK